MRRTVWIFLGLASLGCEPAKAPPAVPVVDNAATVSDETVEVAPSEPATPKEMEYQYGSWDSTWPTDLPEDLAARLESHQPEGAEMIRRLVERIEEKRKGNTWLDASLKDPVGTPLVSQDGKNVGPTSAQRYREHKQTIDPIRDDYLENGLDSPIDKQEIVELYETLMIPIMGNRLLEPVAYEKLYDQFQSGNHDPLIIYMICKCKSLPNQVRRDASSYAVDALRSRPYSTDTCISLFSSVSRFDGLFSPEQIDFLNREAIEAFPDFLNTIDRDPALTYVRAYEARRAFAKLPMQAKVDLLPDVIDWCEQSGDPGLALLHDIRRSWFWSIARRARGTEFMSEVSEADYAIFDEYGEKARGHAIAAYLYEDTNPYHAKTLATISRVYSVPPYSSQQWYRISCLSQCDSISSADNMSWTLMSRYGGSREQLTQFVKRTIEQVKADPQNQICFHEPMQSWLLDAGYFSNIAATSELDDAIIELVDHLEEINPDGLDERLMVRHLILIVKTLWDAGEVDRMFAFWTKAANQLPRSWLVSYSMPLWLIDWYWEAFKIEEVPKEALLTLHQDLFCGDEFYDEDRIDRIAKAIEELKSFSKKLKKNQTEPTPNLIDQFIKQASIMHEQIIAYREGESVELVGLGPWTHSGNAAMTFNPESVEINAYCNSKDCLAAYLLRFEMPFTVQMEITQGPCDADPYGVALFAGQLSTGAHEPITNGRSLRYSPGYPMIMQDSLPAESLKGPDYHEEHLWPVPKQAVLKMEVRADGVRSFVNDRLITDFASPISTGGFIQFGRRTGATFTGVPEKRTANYKISSIRIKKL